MPPVSEVMDVVGRTYFVVCPRCGHVDKGETWTQVEENCVKMEVDDTGKLRVLKETQAQYVEHECQYKVPGHIEDFVVGIECGEIAYTGEYWDSPRRIVDAKKILAVWGVVAEE